MEINRGEMLQFPLPRALKPECIPLQLCGLCAKRCILTLVFYVIQGFKYQQGKIMLSFLLICAVYFFCCFGILSAQYLLRMHLDHLTCQLFFVSHHSCCISGCLPVHVSFHLLVPRTVPALGVVCISASAFFPRTSDHFCSLDLTQFCSCALFSEW